MRLHEVRESFSARDCPRELYDPTHIKDEWPQDEFTAVRKCSQSEVSRVVLLLEGKILRDETLEALRT